MTTEVDYGYGDAAPDYGYGDGAPDYGYGDGAPDSNPYGYGDARPDESNPYGYGDAKPDDADPYGYGDAKPDDASPYGYGNDSNPYGYGDDNNNNGNANDAESQPGRRQPYKRRCSVTKYSLQAQAEAKKEEEVLDYGYGDTFSDEKSKAMTEETANSSDEERTPKSNLSPKKAERKGVLRKIRQRLSIAF